jgi:hypothetical protein
LPGVQLRGDCPIMKDGFWINYDTDAVFEIDEHERWLRRDDNADRLGVPADVIARFGEFVPRRDRDRFLTFVMSHAPVMRVRGHGVDVTFEFAAENESPAMRAIDEFCTANAGLGTWMRISNLLLKRTNVFLWAQR